jgi:PAS domain S-box-containing protein
MEKKRILIVEDERIVAEDIKMNLQSLGYAIPGIVSSGEEAIRKTEEHNPDLVLMDISLKGDIDGIETATQIRSRFDIPIVYLTAYADEKTIERAKITEPFGYIIKPFDDRGLHVNIEMSLYKHRMEKKLKESEKWFSTTLLSINDAVIATDDKGFVTFMNPVAEELTGWKAEKAIGQPLKIVFKIIGEKTCKVVNDPLSRAILGGSVFVSPNETVLKAKDGMETAIEESSAPIKDEKGNIMGIVLVFRDITERKQAEKALKQQAEDLERANIELRRAFDGLFKRLEEKQKSVSEKLVEIGTENRGTVLLYPLEHEAQARSQFLSMLDAGIPVLAVVRTPPQRFRTLLGRDVETVWLTTNRSSNDVCLNPSNITRLSMVLTEFFKRAPDGVVYFEGLEYLLSIVGFQDLLGLIQLLRDKIALNEGTIYLILDMGVLGDKEARHIQRECLLPPKIGEIKE